ncbi:hypothetical protein I2485_14985 [Nesterenkonia sp. E16_7]|uniref:DUF6668 family protein n=1 Tax=unclassified Nesterenkonia TaxID=2629769 RepID=UPI001A921211|nr:MULTISPECIES: DUF6668 family protein [unclassified Nesterenkonia]MBO0596759.1 hypothetical protein [Nesterenkonia sp. E16_10]MBO0599954.1 hypothetical protein [Nesterenkonia sp. E16_7]
MQRSNPFTQAPPEEPENTVEMRDDVLGNQTIVNGPPAPLPFVSPPADMVRWPRIEISDHRLITVAGLHGGAGTSTVAAMLGDQATDAGTGWPVAAGWVRPLPTLRVVVVARTHWVGLDAAENFTQQWISGELTDSRLLGLVLVDDAPKLMEQQRRAVKRLLQKVPTGAHIPWVEHWRIQAPDFTSPPKRLQKIIRTFHTKAEEDNT